MNAFLRLRKVQRATRQIGVPGRQEDVSDSTFASSAFASSVWWRNDTDGRRPVRRDSPSFAVPRPSNPP